MAQTKLKTDAEWQQTEGRELLKLQARQMLNRIINKAVFEWDLKFNDALHNDTLEELKDGRDDLHSLLLEHLAREQMELPKLPSKKRTVKHADNN